MAPATHRITVKAVNALGTRSRAGHSFTREPQTVEVTGLAREAIMADPMLVITGTEEPKKPEGNGVQLTREMSPMGRAVEAINAASTAEDVEAMIAGDDRKGVRDAAIARITVLSDSEG